MFGKFTLRHRTTLLCAKFVKIVRREIREIVRDLTDQKKNKKNIDIQAMLVWLTLPFYDFCGFRSVAVNTVYNYKLQFFYIYICCFITSFE